MDQKDPHKELDTATTIHTFIELKMVMDSIHYEPPKQMVIEVNEKFVNELFENVAFNIPRPKIGEYGKCMGIAFRVVN
jgi:hypothetical protein